MLKRRKELAENMVHSRALSDKDWQKPPRYFLSLE